MKPKRLRGATLPGVCAISLVAIALALLEGGDQKTRGELAWFMRKYAAQLDGTEEATH